MAANAGKLDVALLRSILRPILPLLLPITCRKKWDPDGNFICRYVPELAKFDNFFYELWKAPIADQKKWESRVTNYDSAAGG